MHRLLPLVLTLALAISVPADRPAPRTRARLDRGSPDAGSGRRRGREHAVTAHDASATAQRGTFDAATGTLTWFDDVYN